MTSPLIALESHGDCALIRIDRADKANSLNLAMTAAIVHAITGAANDDAVRSVVLTAAGERIFCAGIDIREQPTDGDMAAQRARRGAGFYAMIDAILECPKPVVAAVNGLATGAGAMMALVCDARVAASTAAVSLPEINLGTPSFAGAAIAMQYGGIALAADLVQTGRTMSAEEAQRRGLFAIVVPFGDLVARAIAHAGVLGAKHAGAFAANKRWLNRGIKAALADARQADGGHGGK